VKFSCHLPYGSFLTRRRSVFQQKPLLSILPAILILFAVFLVRDAEAQFSSQFSLSVGEEYNDNIFFLRSKEHDFITYITPTLSFFYTPPGGTYPTFRANISPLGEIFARHGDLNNFGENILSDAGYTYFYSPRLTFHLSDTLRRYGETRTRLGGGGVILRSPRSPTSPPPPGGTEPLPVSQGLGDFLSTGDTLTNYLSAGGSFLYAPNISFMGGYSFGYTNFLDRGGNETSHSLNARGIYNWRQQHNLHAGYGVSIIKSRDGDDNVVHNFDIGDDYFSSQLIKLTPTLTLSFSTGVSVNIGSEGPRVANNTNLTLTKVWETAMLTAGVNKGLTPSFGISGLSDTTTFFTGFNIRLTERLTGIAGVDYSLYDTDDVNFNTFEAGAGFQYAITNWLCSNLGYSHSWIDGGRGSTNTEFLNRGTVHSNSVSLVFSALFDVWPSPGLAKSSTCPVTPLSDRRRHQLPFVAQPPVP
jgi:hypothetical protein